MSWDGLIKWNGCVVFVFSVFADQIFNFAQTTQTRTRGKNGWNKSNFCLQNAWHLKKQLCKSRRCDSYLQIWNCQSLTHWPTYRVGVSKNTNSDKLLLIDPNGLEEQKSTKAEFCLLKKVIFALVTSGRWWEQTFWKPFCLLFLNPKSSSCLRIYIIHSSTCIRVCEDKPFKPLALLCLHPKYQIPPHPHQILPFQSNTASNQCSERKLRVVCQVPQPTPWSDWKIWLWG